MYKEKDDIIVNLTVTQKCYAGCRDCINSSLTFPGQGHGINVIGDMECDPERDVAVIQAIADKYPDRDITLCFYGGEPFLEPGRMEHVRTLLEKSQAAGRIRYMAYSNGELIARAADTFPGLIRSIYLFSISIDGSHRQHEMVRPGTSLKKVIDNLIRLRHASEGSILMWSTLREEQSLMDCFSEFISLHRHGLADHFFWHWADTRQPYSDFKAYAKQYEEELDQVLEHYVSWLSDGEILPVAHINELVLYLLEGKNRGHTACGVELAQNYDIQGGRVNACADLPSSWGAYSEGGSIEIPATVLQSLVTYREELGCRNCSVYFYCGGRCPVQALAGSPERTRQICKLMHIQVNTVKRYIGYISKMLKKHNISRQQLYDGSACMARYTDVVP